MGKTIAVMYPGPGVKTPAQTTWHPKLGELMAGMAFELEENAAQPYLAGGLLARVDDDNGDDRAEACGTITDRDGGVE